MKILVISLAGIGDTLLATPLLRVLREHYPQATIDVLVMWAGAKQILEGNPHVNTVYHEALIKKGTLGSIRDLLPYRQHRYDLSINTYPQSKFQYRVITRIIGADRRISHRYGLHSALDFLLVSQTVAEDYEVHCIDNNLNLLRPLGIPLPPKPLDCEIFFTEAEKQWAENFAREQALGEKLVLGLHVGSGKTKNLILKRWPLEQYVTLLQRLLAAQPKLTVLLFGGPEEKEDNEFILQQMKGERVLQVPSRTIKQAAAALGKCDLFLSVDNAFMHLAATMKVPQQIVIESPTFNKTIHPYHRPFRLVQNPLVAGRNLEYYRYDGRDIQGTTEHLLACMRSITPEAVFQIVSEAIREVRK